MNTVEFVQALNTNLITGPIRRKISQPGDSWLDARAPDSNIPLQYAGKNLLGIIKTFGNKKAAKLWSITAFKNTGQEWRKYSNKHLENL